MFCIPKKIEFFGSTGNGIQRVTFALICSLSAVFLVLSSAYSSEGGGGAFSIPPLEKIIPLALEKNQDSSKPESEIIFRVKEQYYQTQYKTNQLGVAEEVKKRFTTAIEKAEERYDEGEGEVTQSDITKLKLGLTGSLNDIIQLENEIHLHKLALAGLTGLEFTAESELEEDTILPVKFPPASFEKVFGEKYSHSLIEQKRLLLKVEEDRAKMKLAQGSRKITRALLVTEVANYDFGIGDSGDLFQALIIYTRVLSGYYETVYNFNVAVADLTRELDVKKFSGSSAGGKISP